MKKTDPSVPEPPELIVARERHAAAERALQSFDERVLKLESDRVRLTSVRQQALDAWNAHQAKVDAAIAAGRFHVPKLSASDVDATLEQIDEQLADIERKLALPHGFFSRAQLTHQLDGSQSQLANLQRAHANACAVADAPELVGQLKAVAPQIQAVWGNTPEFNAGVAVSRQDNIVTFKVALP